MRLSQPRIAPLPESEWTEEQRELLTKGNPPRVLNIFRTLVRHPQLYRRFSAFGTQVLFKSTLAPREREMVILRVGWLCRSGYEFHQHTRLGKAAGLTAADIERIKLGPDAPGWSPIEATLLRAVDELHRDHFVSDASWQALAARYTTEQVIDLVFAVGQYTMVSMVLNTFGVQIEED
ncbi:MAG: carboxymuconolactone decarboxylase family protein [Steroidobacter sp.]